jgi:hypothetical protein
MHAPTLLSSLLSLLLVASAQAEELEPSRFHCVQYNEASNVGLFRSNMPVDSSARPDAKYPISPSDYAYDKILSLASSTAALECQTSAFINNTPYLIDLSLANSADDLNGLLALRAFWGLPENWSKGRLVEWPIGTAGIVSPSLVDSEKYENITSEMWVVDQLRK